MFSYIIIDNVAGIDSKIKLDFNSQPRKREKNETIIEVEKGVKLNRITGIIGGNASR